MFFGYFVGVAMVGAGIAALAVHMIWNRIGTDPHPFVVILSAVAGAAAAMALQRYVIIVATSFAGAWTWILGGVALTEGRDLVSRPDVWVIYPLDFAGGRAWVLGGWALLGIIGVLIQLKFTGRAKAPARARAKT
jgi:hypothetical protein